MHACNGGLTFGAWSVAVDALAVDVMFITGTLVYTGALISDQVSCIIVSIISIIIIIIIIITMTIFIVLSS